MVKVLPLAKVWPLVAPDPPLLHAASASARAPTAVRV
jgi:hypothetical protein